MGSEVRVSIGQARRDISELVNRVAFGGERVVLTSRGKPKAVVISVEDYQLLRRQVLADRLAAWEAWVAESDRLAEEVMERRQGELVPVDELWQAARADLEARDEQIAGR